MQSTLIRKPGLLAPLRRGYDRLQKACQGPNAIPAFGALSFLESSLLPVPLDMAMLPLCLSQPRKLWFIVLVGAAGSLLGALLGYAIGALAMESIGASLVRLYGISDLIEVMKLRFAVEGVGLLLISGITPLPFKFITMLSGAAGMSLTTFMFVVFSIRLLRFALMGVMIRIFGAGLKRMIDRRPGWYLIALLLGAACATIGAAQFI